MSSSLQMPAFVLLVLPLWKALLLKASRLGSSYHPFAYQMQKSPFDDLVIKVREGDVLYQDRMGYAQHVLENMELNGEIFPLAYINGNLVIFPETDIYPNISFGAKVRLYILSYFSDKDEFDPMHAAHLISAKTPAKETYDWKQFLPNYPII